MSASSSSRPMPFLSAQSANAMVSDLRPTTLSESTLYHINLFLDELMTSLIISSQSLNPSDLRGTGIPAVFSGDKTAGESTGPRSLGRSAVGEAEMELRSWIEQNSHGVKGFPPNGKGRGLTEIKERSEAKFPEREAVDLMRIRVALYSTLAKEGSYTDTEEAAALAAWKAAGGEVSSMTIDPSGLWLTAIVEHVCEHLLNRLSSVVARDSSVATAGVQDLLTTLYEDETMYGFFKRMKVKDVIENAIRSSGPRSKRSARLSSAEYAGRQSPNLSNTSPRASKTSLVSPVAKSSPTFKKTSLPPAQDVRSSSDSGRFANLGRKVSAATKKSHDSPQGHERAPSVLSVNTRSMLGAFHEALDEETVNQRSPQQEQDEFDALVKSGQTMKVSLTPSRLKTFESSGRKVASPSPFRRPQATSSSHPSNPPGPSVSKSDSMPVMGGQKTPRGASSRSRASSGSTAKLVARGAGTIHEGDDEEDPFGSKSKKESLKELLDSETPPRIHSRQSSIGATQRTAPAVVLATPPPRETSLMDRSGSSGVPSSQTRDSSLTQSASFASFAPSSFSPSLQSTSGLGDRNESPTKPSTNRPGRETLIDDDGDEGSGRLKRKPRSEARELADFLSNTPPPISTTRVPVAEPPPTGKSGKSFKSFMSKITGGKKDDDKASSASTEEIPSAPRVPKRVKSAAAMSSNRGPPPTLGQPIQPIDEPPVPPKSQRLPRKKSDANGVAALAAGVTGAAGMGAIAAIETGPTDRDDLNETPRRTVVSRVSGSASGGDLADQVGLADLKPTRVTRIGPALEDEKIGPTTPVEPNSGNLINDPSGEQLNRSRVPTQLSIDPRATNTPGGVQMDRVPTATSDAHSFKTADEGADMDEADHQSSSSERGRRSIEQREEVDTIIGHSSIGGHDIIAGSATSHATDMLPDSSLRSTDPSAPSIPMDRLIPLRGLLDHATSVQECRMLLSAILSHLQVPQRPEGDIEVTPESRLAAWLLAGGYGPGDTAHTPPETAKSSRLSQGDQSAPRKDENLTPTKSHPAVMDWTIPPSSSSKANQGDEEILSTQSEMSSEDSFSRDDVDGEMGRPSVAKAARRESAVNLLTGGYGHTGQ
ncbi:hypothetical protein BD324DRAFT_615203 [Kockovaella imperatae]|uniref:Uncharacterized protein n=1 Tax=Kockovaella imperatae TaxID=4999 RepID=A0A1Y1UPA5_9TREE|nr:hypothetical protein BD324DRAFT_615203 [Kockovaella imperatae]ORX39839.1 hypothetical protein BD324DRAFT_615203 [Kockovaella imperatae]